MSLFWQGTKTTLVIVAIVLALVVNVRTSGNQSDVAGIVFWTFLIALILGGVQMLCGKPEHVYARGWVAGFKTAMFVVGTILVLVIGGQTAGDVSFVAFVASVPIIVAGIITFIQFWTDNS